MRLKELRKARKWKQTDVAELLSCSQGVYSRYESEEREPPFDIIKKLADIYGVSIDYLMGHGASSVSVGDSRTESHSETHGETNNAPADDRAEAKRILQGMSDERYQEALRFLKFLQSQDK